MGISAKDIIEANEVVIGNRSVNDGIVNYLSQIIDSLNSLEVFFKNYFIPDKIRELLDEALPSAGEPEGRFALIEDMVQMGRAFFESTESKHIRFQLEIIQSDMCRLFHQDNMRQRLLCTYFGPGTEWLDASNVYREGLGKGDNDKIVKDYSGVKRANPFDILLLKGSRYGGPEEGVVHRSPPIAQDELVRVLFKIDECLPY